jgi:hypothetical protein
MVCSKSAARASSTVATVQKVLGAPGVELETDGLRVQPSAAREINERYDAYVIPLANAFRPGYETQLIQLTKLLRRLTIPVSILGVGADGTIDGTRHGSSRWPASCAISWPPSWIAGPPPAFAGSSPQTSSDGSAFATWR